MNQILWLSLYYISHLRFEGVILEVDNIFRREGISCLCDITDVGLYFLTSDTGTKKLFVVNFSYFFFNLSY